MNPSNANKPRQLDSQPVCKPTRKLEEILQDPDANWSDIRTALKARGPSACTNAGLMRAIAEGTSSTETEINKTMPCRGVSSTVHLSDNNATKSEVIECGDFLAETMPLNDCHMDQHTGLKPRRRQSCRTSLKSSVNMMDFGVDNFSRLLEEDDSVRSHEMRSNGNIVGVSSIQSDLSRLCDADGFLNWELTSSGRAAKAVSARKLEASKGSSNGLNGNKFVSVSSIHSDLSMLCDADGFLGWEMSASNRANATWEAEKIARAVLSSECDSPDKVASHDTKRRFSTNSSLSNSSNYSNLCDADGFLGWDISASNRATTALEAEKIAKAVQDSAHKPDDRGLKQFPIEDNEGSNQCTNTFHDTKRLNFLSSRRSSAPTSLSSNFLSSRRSSVTSHHPATDSSNNASVNIDEVKQALMKCCKGTHNTEQTPKQQTKTRRSTLLTLMHQFHPSKSTHLAEEHSNETGHDAREDTREAIWINPIDGDVDIQKECRKLYLHN